MTTVYVLVPTAVYDHDIVGVFSDEATAIEHAKNILVGTDGHHDIRIEAIELDDLTVGMDDWYRDPQDRAIAKRLPSVLLGSGRDDVVVPLPPSHRPASNSGGSQHTILSALAEHGALPLRRSPGERGGIPHMYVGDLKCTRWTLTSMYALGWIDHAGDGNRLPPECWITDAGREALAIDATGKQATR